MIDRGPGFGRSSLRIRDTGESSREVLRIIQATFPEKKGLAIVTEAPPVYCPSHTAAVKAELK